MKPFQAFVRIAAFAILSLTTLGCENSPFADPLSAGPLVRDSGFGRLAAEYEGRTPRELIGSLGPAPTRDSRNQVLNDLLVLSDYRYEQFKRRLYGGDAAFHSLFDLAALGTSTAGAFAGGAAPILAGASAAIQGAQGRLTNRFLLEKTTEAILNAIETVRAQKNAAILVSMQSEYADYPLDAGLRDVLEYHYAASLVNGLSHLAAQSGQEKSLAARELQIAASPPQTARGRQTTRGSLDAADRHDR